MQPFRTLPFDEDGGREVFDGPVKQKQQSNIPLIPPRKIYPVEGHVNNDAKDQNSEKSSTKSVSSHQNAARPGMKISHEHRTLRRWVLLVDGGSHENHDSLARKRIKLLMKFGDLALETLLLYQMLEAAMMFVPHERAPLAETLIDVLFDFLIIVGCPMLVIFYCLSSFTFDRVLPEELRRCKGLRHLSLQYTHTQTFPAWIKEFTKLEYLHVDSKISSPMVVLPDDMFEDMSALTFLHFAARVSPP
ncbi:hypothetical protein PC113_g11740 [Phytophthora cactorum]|uniref:Uncharacterized protein n=1 Tax=Phytophthora cactorum TaxID=29920 RepID=A0A8T0Z241_9STRA|nr:hypothetical protein PC113_g11740 [Phytophthora cactorum]